MIDEMPNAALIAYVTGSDDSSEVEVELAERLGAAIHEIETLVDDLNKMRAIYGDGT